MDKTVQTGWIFFEPIGGQLNEGADDPSKPLVVQGVLQRANAKNQNGRVYPKDILEREVKKYDDNFVKERRALGELDHPDSSVVNLQNVSHNVVEMMWNGDDLVGKVEILPTPSGNILKALFKAGIKLGISSRGLGSVRKNVRENADEVQDDFELIAFDFVSNPSTRGAFLFPSGALNESVQNTPVNKYAKIESLIHDIISEVK